MSSLHITLFGRIHYTADGQEVGGMEARKAQELLIYLLLHRTHPCTRDSLATLLWGERNDVQARKYLRQALWQLQSALDHVCHPAVPLLHADAEWIELNPAVSIWLDVEEFEHAYTTTHRLEGNELSPVQVDELCRVVKLYQGELLEGWYQDWCIIERERFQQMYLTVLDRLIAYAEHTQDYTFGIHYCELALRCDPARERTHRRLMRLHSRAGNRTAALRQYETCVAMLLRELGVEPAKSTQSLYEQIRRDQFTEQNNNVLLMTPAYADQAELTDILFQLGQIQTTLAQTLHQVQREIARVETLVHLLAADAPDAMLPLMHTPPLPKKPRTLMRR
ncbi:MAG: BTAD domain-containing putative transcriptional regulator [Caldilinea sp.]